MSVLSNPRWKYAIKVAALVLVGCVLGRANVVAAQEVRALSVEDAIKTREFCAVSPVAISPDGKLVAYTVTQSHQTRVNEQPTSAPWFAAGGQIFVLDIYTGEQREVTAGEGDNWLPTWSPDGLYLVFLSDRDISGQARVWAWNRTEGDLRKISDMDLKTEALEWIPGSEKLIITTAPERTSVEKDAKGASSGASNAKPNVEKTVGSTVSLYRSTPALSSDLAVPKSDPWDLDWAALRDLTSIDIKTGTMVTLVHGQRIAAYRLSPDGSHIAYTIPKRFEKPGSQQVLFDIAVVTLANSQSQIIATDIRFDDDGAEFSWSPDGARVIFRTGGMEERAYDCFVVGIDDGVLTKISMPQRPQSSSRNKSATPLWDRDGDHIYFVRDGALWRGSVVQKTAERFAEISGRRITQLVSQSPYTIWTSEPKKTIVLAYDDVGKQDGFYEISLTTGDNSKLLEASQCYTCVSNLSSVTLSKDGQYAFYFAEDAQHPSDLWISDRTFKAPRRLTSLAAQFDKYHFGEVRLIHWLSDDGDPLQGALLLPADYQPGKRYPLIVYVYGGASLSNHLNRFGLAARGALNMQLFSTRGFAVLLPDTPLHVGTPMFDLAKTVLPGVNKVIEMGIADGDRLGVMGHSFGGYSTLSLIVQTKRFSAAMEVDGDADAIGFYGEMNKDGAAYGIPIEEEGQGSMGGTLWNRRDRYIENSPIFYLDRVATPLLIVQGTEDQAVAPFLADEMFVGLRRLGKEVEYAKYQGERHSPAQEWSYANQTDFCNRMIVWFDRYLKVESSK